MRECVCIDLESIEGNVSSQFYDIRNRISRESGFFALRVRAEHEPIFRQLASQRIEVVVVASAPRHIPISPGKAQSTRVRDFVS